MDVHGSQGSEFHRVLRNKFWALEKPLFDPKWLLFRCFLWISWIFIWSHGCPWIWQVFMGCWTMGGCYLPQWRTETACSNTFDAQERSANYHSYLQIGRFEGKMDDDGLLLAGMQDWNNKLENTQRAPEVGGFPKQNLRLEFIILLYNWFCRSWWDVSPQICIPKPS